MSKTNTHYIFVTGGVISGIGKGVTAASIALLLKSRGFKVTAIKCETYLNIDSGTINPIEHGDPFLCNDGLEADMDLGTYERFLDIEMGRKNFVTMGQIYKEIIEKERNMGFGGKTVDAVPIIPNTIIEKIKKAGEGHDFCIVELGGTAGEYQNIYNYEAARMMKLEAPNNCMHIHVSYVPIPEHLGEPKTKPTQLSVRFLNMAGIQPDFAVLRSNKRMDSLRLDKVALQCNVPTDNIILNPDLKSIYQLPLEFLEQKFDTKILKMFKMQLKKINLKTWKDRISKQNKLKKTNKNVIIAGKYISTGEYTLTDSYNSLLHALEHASLHIGYKFNIKFVNTEDIEKNGTEKFLFDADGIIVPIGWGSRGVEGKIEAIKFSRLNKIPYLGLCFGMQLACVEFARNVVGLKDANTEEVNPNTDHKIIHSIPFDEKYQTIKGKNTSMRLGAFDCIVKPHTLVNEIYSKHRVGHKQEDGSLVVSERHRHRYEFNNNYKKLLENHGMIFSGTSPDEFFVEMIELSQNLHPFFVATQAHPEYKSTPTKPHPIFIEFLLAIINN